jgi:hypothetical protein
MPGNMLKLGPFTGGLNNFSDPTAIKDQELAVCQNFDFDVDGTLISRPPFTVDGTTGPVAGQNVDFIGFFTDLTGASYLLGATTSALYYRTSGAWTLITNTYAPDAGVQYLDKMWLPAPPGSANPGGSWSPSGGFTAIPTMPKGSAISIFKERLWIAAGPLETTNGSRLFFSAIADGTTWNGADFIDVNKGDGQKLIDIYSLSTNLYLFKENATFVLQYDSAPNKGVINPVSKTIGVAGIRCVVQYENILYLFYGDYLYELINYTFNKTNIRVSIVNNSSGTYSTDIWVSLIGNRVLVFYYGNLYVFYLFTRTWSKWVLATQVARPYYQPNSAIAGADATYVCNSNSVADVHTYTFKDGYDPARTEAGVHARLETKIYDLNSPNMFKKLYWWGADAFFNGTVDCYVVPVIYNFSVTWAQMAAFTWAQVTSNTWARPSETDISIHEQVTAPGPVRKFIKIMKSIRFRNVYFILDFTVSDWLNPVKVYSLTPVVAVKEQVPKTVN